MADQSPPSEKPSEPVADGNAAAAPASAEAPTLTAAEKIYPKPETPAAPVVEAPKAETPAPVPPVEPPKAPEVPVVAPSAVPEKYEFSSKDGVTLDASFVEALTPTLKDAKVSAEGFQKIAQGFVTAQMQAIAKVSEANKAAIMQDPELGGANWAATAQSVNRALEWGTTAQERALLEQLGVGNNPGLVRMFKRIGDSLKNDTPLTGKPDSVQPKSLADRIYGRK